MSKLPDLSNVKVGDVLQRVMKGFKKDEKWRWDAQVIEISDSVITCSVTVDVPRTMKFDRQTGMCIDGDEFGWLE